MEEAQALPKPDELLSLHGISSELFTLLREWFAVPEMMELNLTAIDSAVRELGEPTMIAAMAMRKLQALQLVSTPGVKTSTDVVVTMVQDLDRALLHAPTLRLRRQADDADWDTALVELLEPGEDDEPSMVDLGPNEGDGIDPEVDRFRQLHGALHQAVRAVLEASAGEIRIFR